jgi:hypothetical protein
MARTFDRTALETGRDVYASDGGRLGTIDEVGADYVLVKKGLLFPRDIYVPTDSIERVDQDGVWLDVSQADLDSFDWSEPPAGSASRTTAVHWDAPSDEAGPIRGGPRRHHV